jgi:hypothetical protein
MTTKQFVQVSAFRDSDNFMHCSNISLLAEDRALTPEGALAVLRVMAAEYAAAGYTVEWTVDEFGEYEEEWYGELFVPLERM